MSDYDYVIVGAGSAGCVLAARLGVDASVLVLEAGPPDDAPEIRMPAAGMTLWTGRYAWPYATVPQPGAAGRSIPWPQGRTLGGGSAINGMVYMRGNRLDYDAWRDSYGCAGWGYADLLPYFRRSEDQQRGESAYHGVGGPLRVEDQRYVTELSGAWLDAARAYGLPGNDDFNGVAQDGVGYLQLTQRGGRRWSTADGYLRPALRRGNVTVETEALASKVLVSGDRAVGVRYMRGGQAHEARARREVILSAGAIRSPQLLLLSGIGPAEQLRSHGIDVVVDAPSVGEGLQDHPFCMVVWRTPNTRNLWEEATPENLARWQADGSGPMTSMGAEAGGFGRSLSGLPAPDLQYCPMPAPTVEDAFLNESRWRGFTQGVIAIAPSSRGRLALRTADPAGEPLIDPGYLTSEADLDALVAGLRQVRELAGYEPLAGHLAGEQTPGPDVADDSSLRAWVRSHVATAFHPTSTCAMGGAATSVCDPSLRVRGLDGLRVVDASVLPAVPRGNTNAPVIAVAERAADLIRGDTPLAPTDPEVAAAV